jgi:FMN-dependent NADH-azoreductase
VSKVLVLKSSALGEASVSNQLVDEVIARLGAQDRDLDVVTRDLGKSPIPHLTLDAAIAIRGAAPANDSQSAAQALSDELIAELKGVDIIVIGAPMYNFGMASTLKTWFDYVLRAGLTFRYTETGPVGLVTNKRAIVVESRGGLYSEGPAQGLDSQEPHLRTLLGFIGVTDVAFVRAEKLAFGPEAREQAFATARAQLGRVVEGAELQAA